MKILIYGNDSAARAVAQTAALLPHVEPVGFIVDQDMPEGKKLAGLPILNEKDKATIEHDGVVIALQSAQERKKAYDRLLLAGETFTTLVHPAAIVAPDAMMQDGCFLNAGVVIGPGCRIRANSWIGTGTVIDTDCSIGPNAVVMTGSVCGADVTLENQSVLLVGAKVANGITIGKQAMVGTGSAVDNDVEPKAYVVGIPAEKSSD